MKWDKRHNLTTKLAYIAGFFDGEGCVRIKESNVQGNSFYVTVAITNSDKKVLEFIQEGFGGQIYHKEKSPNFEIYQWYSTSGEAVDFLRSIRSYLRGKQKQADLAISFYESYAELLPSERRAHYVTISAMKRGVEIIGNIYENPDLLKV